MLCFGEEMRTKSLGNFNIGVGGILEDLGYDKDYSFTSKSNSKEQQFDLGQSVFLILNKSEIKIQENVKIDLGGLGKGWLIDKIVSFLLQHNVKFFNINGGGDIYCTSNFDTPVEFILENPVDVTQSIGKIQIMNQGIACSASNRRQWLDKRTKQRCHHLINLEEKSSQNEKIAVFTSGSDALLADVAATTIFVAKPEQIEIIAKNLNVEFLIIWSDLSYVKSFGYLGELFS